MKSPHAFVRFLVYVCTVGFAGVVQAVPIVDQQSPIDPSPTFTTAIGGDSEQILAQVVTTGISGFLVGLELPVAGTGGLTVEIRDVVGGLPGSASLLSETFTAGLEPPVDLTFRTILFSSGIFFSAGDNFAIVLSSVGSYGIAPAPVGDAYAGGDAFFDARPNPPGVWVDLSLGTGIQDLAFKTLVAVPEPGTLALFSLGLFGLGLARKRTA